MSHHHHEDLRNLGIEKGRERVTIIFKVAIILNVLYVVIEGFFAFVSDSMGLLSDAGHNLSDIASLLIAYLAIKAKGMKPNDGFTYGFRKSTVVASLANAVILYVAVGVILVESIEKLLSPVSVDGDMVAWVAGAGVLVKGFTTWLFVKGSKHDLNIKGAYLHMMADTLVSVGVVIAGVVIALTGWMVIDPIIGIVIAIMIAITSWTLLRESFRMVLDGVPSTIDIEAVRKAILGVGRVEEFHHLHIWSLSTTDTAMTVHVLVKSPEAIDGVICGVRKAVIPLGINHSTIEAESMENEGCRDECQFHTTHYSMTKE